jgi:hypothetical protein
MRSGAAERIPTTRRSTWCRVSGPKPDPGDSARRPVRRPRQPADAAVARGARRRELSDDELRRLALWIDLNALFYGVHEAEDQERMRRGEPVGMPEIQ